MAPRLSIIIPVPHGSELLEETLVSVLENRPRNCEVIVVHPGCYADPYDLSDEVQFLESAHHQALVDLANLGLEAAGGDVIHLLACGAHVAEDWAEPAIARLHDPEIHSVCPAVLDAADANRLAAAGVSYGRGGRRVISGRRRRFGEGFQAPKNLLGPTLAAGFYRRRTLQGIGGLERRVGTRLADLDLALTLSHLGCQNVFEPDCRVVLDPALLHPAMGNVRQGWCAERFFWRHACTQSWADLIAAHPLLATGELVADVCRLRWPRLIGRLAGSLCAPRDYGHPDRIFELPQPSDDNDSERELVDDDSSAEAVSQDRSTLPLVRPGDSVPAEPTSRLRKAG